MHKLFTYFDDTVHANGLFKMDTVGDAYIVAALLDRNDADAQERACKGMLEVAKAMILGLERHHSETGQRIQCRIGVAVGEVTTGVLGHLQTRFHVTGQGLQAAEALEQSAPMKDTLHASGSFLDALRLPDGELDIGGWTLSPEPSAGHTLSLAPPPELASARAC